MTATRTIPYGGRTQCSEHASGGFDTDLFAGCGIEKSVDAYVASGKHQVKAEVFGTISVGDLAEAVHKVKNCSMRIVPIELGVRIAS